MIKLNIKEMPQWRKNLYVLAFGDFVSGTGFSMSLPFLPLFISQMAHFTNADRKIIGFRPVRSASFPHNGETIA